MFPSKFDEYPPNPLPPDDVEGELRFCREFEQESSSRFTAVKRFTSVLSLARAVRSKLSRLSADSKSDACWCWRRVSSDSNYKKHVIKI